MKESGRERARWSGVARRDRSQDLSTGFSLSSFHHVYPNFLPISAQLITASSRKVITLSRSSRVISWCHTPGGEGSRTPYLAPGRYYCSVCRSVSVLPVGITVVFVGRICCSACQLCPPTLPQCPSVLPVDITEVFVSRMRAPVCSGSLQWQSVSRHC